MYFCIKYLGRHPIETNLTIDQLAEVAYVARSIEKAEGENATAILKALLGSRL
jgi:hypothetical protein